MRSSQLPDLPQSGANSGDPAHPDAEPRRLYNPPMLRSYEFSDVVRGVGSMNPDGVSGGPTGDQPDRPRD